MFKDSSRNILKENVGPYERTKEIYRAAQHRQVICRWTDFLNPPVQNMRQEATGSLIAPSTPLSPANLRRCATIASPASRDPRRVDLYPVRNAKLNASSPFGPSIIQSISKLQHCRSQNDDTEAKPSKSSRSNSQTLKSKQDIKVTHALEDSPTKSLYAPSDEPFENRLFCCLEISPAGKAIHEFQSIKEQLEALRDAIKAHTFLYLTGKILHKDISENSSMITDPEKAAGFTGILIDVDLAKEVGSKPSVARHQTGTMDGIHGHRGAPWIFTHLDDAIADIVG